MADKGSSQNRKIGNGGAKSTKLKLQLSQRKSNGTSVKFSAGKYIMPPFPLALVQSIEWDMSRSGSPGIHEVFVHEDDASTLFRNNNGGRILGIAFQDKMVSQSTTTEGEKVFANLILTLTPSTSTVHPIFQLVPEPVNPKMPILMSVGFEDAKSKNKTYLHLEFILQYDEKGDGPPILKAEMTYDKFKEIISELKTMHHHTFLRAFLLRPVFFTMGRLDSTTLAYPILQHSLFFLPGVFGSRLWVKNKSGVAEKCFPAWAVFGNIELDLLVCDELGIPKRPVLQNRLSVFRNFTVDKLSVPVYSVHEEVERIEKEFPKIYLDGDKEKQLSHIAYTEVPYDWRLGLQEYEPDSRRKLFTHEKKYPFLGSLADEIKDCHLRLGKLKHLMEVVLNHDLRLNNPDIEPTDASDIIQDYCKKNSTKLNLEGSVSSIVQQKYNEWWLLTDKSKEPAIIIRYEHQKLIFFGQNIENSKYPFAYPFLSEKVSLAGHSTGGVLIRGLVSLDTPLKDIIAEAFFINVPFWGAPKAEYIFFTGNPELPFIKHHESLRQIACNMPIVYFLSPAAVLQNEKIWPRGYWSINEREKRVQVAIKKGGYNTKPTQLYGWNWGDRPKLQFNNMLATRAKDYFEDCHKIKPNVNAYIFHSTNKATIVSTTLLIESFDNQASPRKTEVFGGFKPNLGLGDGTVPTESQTTHNDISQWPSAKLIKPTEGDPIHKDAANSEAVWNQIYWIFCGRLAELKIQQWPR